MGDEAAQALRAAADWFLSHGWKGETWTREAVAKQLLKLAEGRS